MDEQPTAYLGMDFGDDPSTTAWALAEALPDKSIRFIQFGNAKDRPSAVRAAAIAADGLGYDMEFLPGSNPGH